MLAQDANEATSDTTEGFRFTTIDSIAITPVKDQNRSGTCWSYSTIGFLESELLRMGKGEYDLSEMFVVHHTMLDRAEYVVRMYGTAQFAPGGSAYDVIYCLKNYGLVPQAAMPGIQYGSTPADTLPVHTELDAVAGGVVDAVANSGLKKLTPVWKKALTSVYDTYLGACPATFTYNGKEYTPKSFAEELGLNADDYVSITSYTHHPYYTTFALEVPDNWRMDQMYNVPMEEMMTIIDNALAEGYTLAWGADVSEMCFTRKGLGVVPEEEKAADLTGSDAARWLGLSATDKREELTKKPTAARILAWQRLKGEDVQQIARVDTISGKTTEELRGELNNLLAIINAAGGQTVGATAPAADQPQPQPREANTATDTDTGENIEVVEADEMPTAAPRRLPWLG